LLCMPLNRWQHMVANGIEEDKNQMAVDRILLKVLESYLGCVEDSVKQVEALDCGLDSQKETMSRRWKQIHSLLTASISRMKG
jgi:hypothetical protein